MAVKFLLSSLFAACWTGAAVGISQPWIDDLSRSVGEPATWVMVTLVAYLPGFVVALMTMSLILDRQPPPRICNPVSRSSSPPATSSPASPTRSGASASAGKSNALNTALGKVATPFVIAAVAFTDAPATGPHFLRQRAPGARGLVEGLHAVPPWRQKRRWPA